MGHLLQSIPGEHCEKFLAQIDSLVHNLISSLLSYLSQILESKGLATMSLFAEMNKRRYWKFTSRSKFDPNYVFEDLWEELFHVSDVAYDGTPSSSNNVAPAAFLYDHLVDIVSSDSIDKNVQKLSVEVMR
jgi:hypothetical protein